MAQRWSMMLEQRWRSLLEHLLIPAGAVVVALLLFGVLCALAGANPLAIYASIYRGGLWHLVCLAKYAGALSPADAVRPLHRATRPAGADCDWQ